MTEPSKPAPTGTTFGPYIVPNIEVELAKDPKPASAFACEYLHSIGIGSFTEFKEDIRHRESLDQQSWKMLCEWLFLV